MSDGGGLVSLYCRRHQAVAEWERAQRQRDVVDRMIDACNNNDYSELIRLNSEYSGLRRGDRHHARTYYRTEPFPTVSL